MSARWLSEVDDQALAESGDIAAELGGAMNGDLDPWMQDLLRRLQHMFGEMQSGCHKIVSNLRAECWGPHVERLVYANKQAEANTLYRVKTDKATGAVTLWLPDAADSTGEAVEVKDVGSNAATNNIVVKALAGQLVDGASSKTLSTNGAAMLFRSDGENWWSVAGANGPVGVTDHGALTGLTDDDHSQYLLAVDVGGRVTFNANWTDLTDAGATTLHTHDHGGLNGLGDDDHSQYHNDTRGDARYLQKSNNLSDLASDDTAIGNLVGGGTGRTPTELYDIPIRDSVASNHGKASVASILTMDPTSIAFGGTPIVGQIPRWHKITIAYNQAGLGDQAAQTADATLFVLPSGGIIHSVVLKHSTDWDNGGGGARIEASVGITGTLNKYAAAFRWDTVVSNTNFQLSTVVGAEAIGATTDIKMQWDSSASAVNLNTGTVGSLDCYVLLSGLL